MNPWNCCPLLLSRVLPFWCDHSATTRRKYHFCHLYVIFIVFLAFYLLRFVDFVSIYSILGSTHISIYARIYLHSLASWTYCYGQNLLSSHLQSLIMIQRYDNSIIWIFVFPRKKKTFAPSTGFWPKMDGTHLGKNANRPLTSQSPPSQI